MPETLAPAAHSAGNRPRVVGPVDPRTRAQLDRASTHGHSPRFAATWAVPGALALAVGLVVFTTQARLLIHNRWSLAAPDLDAWWDIASSYIVYAAVAGISVVAATAIARWRPRLAAVLVIWPFISIFYARTFVWAWWLAALFVVAVLTFDATSRRWRAPAAVATTLLLVAGWYCVSGASALLPVGFVTAGTGHDLLGLYVTLYLGSVGAVVCGAAILGPIRRNELRARAQLARVEAEASEAFEAEAATSERARAARDLHDVVAHHVSLVAVRAESAPYVHPELDATAREVLGNIANDARDALDELRQVLTILQRAGHEDAPRLPQPGGADVASLVADAKAAGQDVELVEPVPDLPAAQGYVVYRAVQEALTNARRHAPGRPVRVEVAVRSGVVGVRVTNLLDGAGSGTTPDAGRGLLGMRERVEALGGAADHAVDDGTFVLSVSLPLPPGEGQR